MVLKVGRPARRHPAAAGRPQGEQVRRLRRAPSGEVGGQLTALVGGGARGQVQAGVWCCSRLPWFPGESGSGPAV